MYAELFGCDVWTLSVTELVLLAREFKAVTNGLNSCGDAATAAGRLDVWRCVLLENW
ncbi:hypothetical protein DPMN_045490 [Dreissena polymorpha]|uniref:Uncharacterized protein n=1 Tax=Dreissena polymorpha TaxID=45954 RepID=A0A9D4HZZ1_DREPO|nr:hypothetical protein DPMN_045490 [Dreissena polymorpha]